jgi:hypothetical protein
MRLALTFFGRRAERMTRSCRLVKTLTLPLASFTVYRNGASERLGRFSLDSIPLVVAVPRTELPDERIVVSLGQLSFAQARRCATAYST